MTVETKTDLSRKTARARQTGPDWRPKARRYGERGGWAEQTKTDHAPTDDMILLPLSPPPTWPRVFPGI